MMLILDLLLTPEMKSQIETFSIFGSVSCTGKMKWESNCCNHKFIAKAPRLP